MASYSVTTGTRSAHAKLLVANTADTVTFADNVYYVEILSDGAAAMYVRADGTAAVVAAAGTVVLPAGVVSRYVLRTNGNVVSLISSGAPTYSVTAL